MRAPNDGDCLVVDSGDTLLSDMIQSVEQGILFGRWGGSDPSINGDFSGPAMNSYLIEKGKIAKPLGDVMVTGNLAEMLLSIRHISREQVDFGHSLLPWIHADGITISSP